MFTVELDSDSATPLYKQVYEGIRSLILCGALSPGQHLPSTRELSKVLSVSRTTATLAYDLLTGEGYIASTPASRTFVRTELPEVFLTLTSPPASNDSGESGGNNGAMRKRESKRFEAVLSSFGQSLLKQSRQTVGSPSCSSTDVLNVSSNAPSIRDFPLNDWKRAVNTILRTGTEHLYEYASNDGCVALRKALAEYLQLSRGVNCKWTRIIVTFGSKQALDLIARMHVDQGDFVGMEEPGYPTATAAFRARGGIILPLHVDAEGLNPNSLNDLAAAPKLVYSTPSHQFPTGGIMPLSRRINILQRCAEIGAFIVEDDYDSEFRYSARPVSALQGMSGACPVVYVGTLSKVMFPSLRLGYIVVPPELQDAYQTAQTAIYGHPPTVTQAAVALFMEWGLLDKHIRRMRNLYSQRRELAIKELQKRFGKCVEIIGDASGLHFIVRIHGGISSARFVDACEKSGIQIRSTKDCYIKEKSRSPRLADRDLRPRFRRNSNDYVFGFGRLNEIEIERAVKAMERAYRFCQREKHPE